MNELGELRQGHRTRVQKEDLRHPFVLYLQIVPLSFQSSHHISDLLARNHIQSAVVDQIELRVVRIFSSGESLKEREN